MATIIEETQKIFQELKGKVFHTVRKDENGVSILHRYRIGPDGKLNLEEKLKGAYLRGLQVQKSLSEAGQEAHEEWRKIVTGDPNKRVRDYMKETPQVKMKDKFSFTLGVMAICLSQWMVLRYPNYFPYFWLGFTAALWIYRFIDYSAQKFELFMLDYCYFVNSSVAIQIMFYPNNLGWFQANYVLTLGPIYLAIIIWQNSLVFHSLDKLTSFFLHAFPPILMHLHRWKYISNDLPIEDDATLPLYSNFVLPLLVYGFWQISYLLATTILLKTYLADKSVVTSYRYLMKGKKKQSVYKWIEKQLVKKGVLKTGEELDPDSALGMAVFVFTQFTYTVIMISHIRLVYSCYTLSVIYLVTVFGVACWNGASYYIEIFSTRYNLKFTEKVESPAEETGTPEDDEKSHFIDTLQKLDLNKPEELKLYANVLGSVVK